MMAPTPTPATKTPTRPVMFSDTVQWHYRNSDGWRLKLAQFFAKNLNIFDDHIK